jgi:hypothetical protein
MAVNPQEMMDMLKQGQGATPSAEAPTPPAFEQEETTAPMASPMSTPEEKKGEQEKARLNIMMALDMLQQSMGAFDPNTPEGKTIEKVVAEITRRFGERESETRQLIPAEILQMIQTLPQAGGATPGQRSAMMAPVAGSSAPPLPM